MNETWGFPIWLYLWLSGMAAGAYFAAFLADSFRFHTDRQLLRMAVYLGLPLATFGVLFLLFDLGHPLRFWHLLTRFNLESPMSMGSWLLILWVGIAALTVALWQSKRRFNLSRPGIDRSIEWLYRGNFALSILLMSYTGVLLAVSNQPLWASTILMPPLFVTSAVSTGVALLVSTLLLTQSWRSFKDLIPGMIKVDVIVIVIELAILVGYLIWLSQTSVSGADEAMRRLITGVLALRFWLGVILLALLIPFALDVFHWGKNLESHKTAMAALGLSSVCVIVGGLILREVLVVGGQI